MTDGIDWNAIEQFVGYGAPDAPFVFVGTEEGLDKYADLEHDLLTRSRYRPYMDLLAAQGALACGNEYIGEHVKSQRTWRPMCDLMLRFENTAPTDELRKRYQGTRLGRIPGQTLLAELLPYPRNKADGSWPYTQWNRFGDFEQYKNALLLPRINLLRTAIHAHPPKLIVCYGKTYWDEYARLANVQEWRDAGAFRFGKDASTGAGVVLTWHFTRAPFNTDEQLAQFYQHAKSALE